MSMLTRCPECETSFRITTDQLVSRQGKVRCGRCQHVFSALTSLVHTREPVVHPNSDPITPLDADPRAAALGGNSRPMAPVADTPSVPPAAADGDTPVARPFEQMARAENKERRERSARGARRTLWLSTAGCVLALTALAAQGAYFYRSQLAALQPETRPWLASMCAQLNCKLEAPVDPGAISIESSSLEADTNDPSLLQLNALLRNRSVVPQKLPHVELTLIDAQEAPLARRVIKPEEYAPRPPAPAKGAPPAPLQLGADGEFQIKLSIDASQVKASGYRVYAFYP